MMISFDTEQADISKMVRRYDSDTDLPDSLPIQRCRRLT